MLTCKSKGAASVETANLSCGAATNIAVRLMSLVPRRKRSEGGPARGTPCMSLQWGEGDGIFPSYYKTASWSATHQHHQSVYLSKSENSQAADLAVGVVPHSPNGRTRRQQLWRGTRPEPEAGRQRRGCSSHRRGLNCSLSVLG